MPQLLLGSLEPVRDFTYVTDTARAFLLLADCDAAVGQTVNYQITVTNTGNTKLKFSNFSDEKCDEGTIAGGPREGFVLPGESTVKPSRSGTGLKMLPGMLGNTGSPLKRTSKVPVKFVPLIVTAAPTRPLVGVKLAIVGGTSTVKLLALVAVPSGAVTEIGPVVAPAGTVA